MFLHLTSCCVAHGRGVFPTLRVGHPDTLVGATALQSCLHDGFASIIGAIAPANKYGSEVEDPAYRGPVAPSQKYFYMSCEWGTRPFVGVVEMIGSGIAIPGTT